MLIKNWYQRLENRVMLERHMHALRTSGTFDESYYRKKNPDTKDVDAIRHFLQNGCDEGRKPNGFFSPRAYLQLNRDVAHSGINPLVHYVLFGQDEGRTVPMLDTAAYFLEKTDEEQTVLFVSHNAHRGGAQKLLLDYMRWLKQNTVWNMKLLCLDGGYFLDRFNDVADVLIYNDVCSVYPDTAKRKDIIKAFAGGHVRLVYGNSLASAAVYRELKALYDVPIITHAHELDKTIRTILDPDAMQQAVEYTTYYVACSQAVRHALMECCAVDSNSISVIYEYIPAAFNPYPQWDRGALRESLGIQANDRLVVGCGNVHWRKGPDLFIQVAERVINECGGAVQFVWVGDFRSGIEPDYGDWKMFREKGLDEQISFIGGHDNPRLILAAADVFLLPSREDPFPVACLEAAACGLPIVCFEDAGGMPELVQGKKYGNVVPYEDVEAMAQGVIELLNDEPARQDKGEGVYGQVVEHHTDAVCCPQMFHLARTRSEQPPEVSIVIPNYNYAQYLRQRIDSVLQQTVQNIEVIILDDASTDQSRDVIEAYRIHPNVRIYYNEENSGGVFPQWRRGIELAQGRLVWIAEADDYAEPEFLEKLLPAFADPEISLAYCISEPVNGEGDAVPGFDYFKYVEEFSKDRWRRDYCATGAEELQAGLAIRNTIPNASAVLFRRPGDDALVKSLPEYTVCGDWYFYINMLKNARLAYRCQVLNHHRLHDQSVVANRVRSMAYFNDVLRIYKQILDERKECGSLNAHMLQQIHKEWDWLMKDTPRDELTAHPLYKSLAAE